MPVARTVMGDIPPQQLGITYSHEHIVLGYTGAREDLGSHFDREAVLKEVCDDLGKAMRDHRVKTIVDVTPPEVGRDMDIMHEVSRRLNVNIIAATGHYTQASGFPFYWGLMDIEQLEERMVREINEGVGPNRVKCGVIKVAMGPNALTPSEEKAFRAAARASKRLGVSICVHATGWLPPGEKIPPMAALDLLLEEGADPTRIQYGHVEGTRGHLGQLLDVAKRGVYMAFDNVGRPGDERDPRTLEEKDMARVGMVTGLIAAGYIDRILLAMDHQGAWVPKRPPRYVKHGTTFSDLGNFLPKLLKAGLKQEQLDKILVGNPRNLFPF
ncbi:MAG: hypothetical protein HYY31_02815 [Chloroflexi bacterium]|nr:hypothetical protein [Chloroflexota bacterium]